MFSYVAYGLGIQSALRLPELVAEEARADVVVRFGRVALSPLNKMNGARRCLRKTAEGVHLFWQDIGAFLVRDGREIIVDPVPGVEERVLRLVVLGPALGVLLHQRGLTVFHASAVAFSAGAVAFFARKGHGKSTMAATLQAQGHDLVADDILAINMNQGCPMALPGFPHLKLWPDSVASLGHAPETLPRLRPKLEKRSYCITTGFARAPVPLKCIYVLSPGPEPEIEPLRTQEAWTALMPHWYGARFGMELLQALGLSTYFLQCVNLAKKITVCRLKGPPSLSVLPDVTRLVEEHLASDLQPVTVRVADLEQKTESVIALHV